MICVNMLGGPGSGKSTVASQLFSLMKWKTYRVELITEYIKFGVYENRQSLFNDQLYLFAKQHRQQYILDGIADYAVTDSPLILSLVYAKPLTDTFEKLVLEYNNKYNNLYFFINRKKEYTSMGRFHTLDEAIEKDNEIKDILDKHNIEYIDIVGDPNAAEIILKHIDKSKNH